MRWIEQRALTVRLTAQKLTRENAMHDVKPGVFHQGLAGLTLYVEGTKNATWSHVLLFDDRVNSRPVLTVAREGEVPPSDSTNEGVEFKLRKGEAHQTNLDKAATVTTFKRAIIRASLGEAGGKMLSFRLMREEMTPVDLLGLAREKRARAESDVAQMASFHERLWQVLMPFAFALLGASLSLIRRRGSRATGIAITMGAYIECYLASRTLQSLGEQGRLAPVLAGVLLLRASWRFTGSTVGGA